MPSAAEPLRNELRIDAPPDVVFRYFTDPARMTDWFGVAALRDPKAETRRREQITAGDTVTITLGLRT